MKIPRPTKVYANFLPGFVEAFSSREDARHSNDEQENSEAYAEAVPCLLLPLTAEVRARLRPKIRQAINWWFDGENDFNTCLERSTDDVMAVMGIVQPRRKRGKRRGQGGGA